MQLRGVHTAIVTPFTDGAVDLDSFRALCRRQKDAGIDGIVVCGTTGETPTLSGDEWAALVSATVEVADGDIPVTAGCGTNSTASSVAHIRRAGELGADAALVVFPYYNKPNPAGHRAHVEACAEPGLPLVLYHVPGRTGQRLDVALLAELCNLEGVVALKEATGDVALGQAVLNHTDRAIMSGDDFTFASLMAMGGHGVISVVSNVAPVQTLAWARAAAAGDRAACIHWRRQLLPVVEYLFSTTNPVPAKAMLARMGLCSEDTRLPLLASGLAPAALCEGLE